MRQELSTAKAAARQAQEHLVDARSKIDDLARQLAEATEHSRQRVELEVKNALLAAAKAEAERVQAEANARLRQRDVAAMGKTERVQEPEAAERVQELEAAERVQELEAAVDAMRKTCDVMRASERALRDEVDSARAVLAQSVTDADLVAAGYNPKAAPVSINVYIPLLNRKIAEALKEKEREGGRGQRLLQHLQNEAAELAAKLEAADSERAAHAKHARALEQETSQLRGEIERARSYLDEKLGKSEMIRTLSSQIAELVRRLQETESHGQWLESQLQHATQALDEAGFELDRFQGAQKAERARLVQLTIEALGQLRQHLTYSLCGLRTSQQTPNPHEALAWKRASGLVAPRGDLLDVVVRFIPPSKSHGAAAVGSISPAERTSSASAHRHHRFDQTSFSPRPSLFYDDGAPPPLAPVQVSPAAGTPQLPEHVTPHGTLMHSDAPASPRLLSISRATAQPYASQPANQHRWGHSNDPNAPGTFRKLPIRAATAIGGARAGAVRGAEMSTGSGLAMVPASIRGCHTRGSVSARGSLMGTIGSAGAGAGYSHVLPNAPGSSPVGSPTGIRPVSYEPRPPAGTPEWSRLGPPRTAPDMHFQIVDSRALNGAQ